MRLLRSFVFFFLRREKLMRFYYCCPTVRNNNIFKWNETKWKEKKSIETGLRTNRLYSVVHTNEHTAECGVLVAYVHTAISAVFSVFCFLVHCRFSSFLLFFRSKSQVNLVHRIHRSFDFSVVVVVLHCLSHLVSFTRSVLQSIQFTFYTFSSAFFSFFFFVR